MHEVFSTWMNKSLVIPSSCPPTCKRHANCLAFVMWHYYANLTSSFQRSSVSRSPIFLDKKEQIAKYKNKNKIFCHFSMDEIIIIIPHSNIICMNVFKYGWKHAILCLCGFINPKLSSSWHSWKFEKKRHWFHKAPHDNMILVNLQPRGGHSMSN